MKAIFTLSNLFLFALSMSFGQKIKPVVWTFEMKKIGNEMYEIKATADIEKGWTLYSQFTDDTGPVPTAFYIGTENIKFTEESKSIKEYDSVFEVDVIKFKEKAIFTLKMKKTNNQSLKGYLTYMTCDGEKCLPPTDVDFNLAF